MKPYSRHLQKKWNTKKCRSVQVVIPLAYKDTKLSLTGRDKVIKDVLSHVVPEVETCRTLHCSVCNTTLGSRLEFEDHINRSHKKEHRNSLKKDGGKISRSSKDTKCTRNRSMNPAKISCHSGLIKARERVTKARYGLNASSSSRKSLLVDGHQAQISHENDTIVTNCHTTIEISSDEQTVKEKACRDTINKSNVRHHCAQGRKKRKINGSIRSSIDIEEDDQKIERILLESLDEIQTKDIRPITTGAIANSHFTANESSHCCKLCHVSRSAQRCLQKEHHAEFPSLSSSSSNSIQKRQLQKVTNVTCPSNSLCKIVPAEASFNSKSAATSSSSFSFVQTQIRNANVVPALADSNHYCKCCHISKPSRNAYLLHLSMIHKIPINQKKKPRYT